jgi:hypothetical protein
MQRRHRIAAARDRHELPARVSAATSRAAATGRGVEGRNLERAQRAVPDQVFA